MRELPQRQSEGTLTAEEADELDQCAQLDQLVLLIRARARREQQGGVRGV